MEDDASPYDTLNAFYEFIETISQCALTDIEVSSSPSGKVYGVFQQLFVMCDLFHGALLVLPQKHPYVVAYQREVQHALRNHEGIRRFIERAVATGSQT